MCVSMCVCMYVFERYSYVYDWLIQSWDEVGAVTRGRLIVWFEDFIFSALGSYLSCSQLFFQLSLFSLPWFLLQVCIDNVIQTRVWKHFLKLFRDFSGGPVKTLPSNAGSASLISDWGDKIPHASQPRNQNTKPKQYCNKFNSRF